MRATATNALRRHAERTNGKRREPVDAAPGTFNEFMGQLHWFIVVPPHRRVAAPSSPWNWSGRGACRFTALAR
jgi:hypothetical protein